MKQLLPLVLVFAFALTACGPSAAKLNSQGNEAFYNQDFAGALTAYQEAQADSPELAEPHYNAASAHYRQGAYEQAQKEIEQALIKDEGNLTQPSLYNLGNSFFQGEQYEQAIEAYKEALRLNADDFEAKQNLELALQQFQQQQQEQEQQDQQQDQNEEQNQEQQQNDQQQNNDGQDQEQNDQRQQDGQEGNQQQDDQQQDGQQNDQQQGDRQEDKQQDNGQQDGQQQDNQQGEDQQQPQNSQPGDQQQQDQPSGQPQIVKGLTKEQARQLLEAAAEGTESLEEYLQQILVAPGAPPAEDW